MEDKGIIPMKNRKIKVITLTVALAVAHLSGCSKNLSFDEYMTAAKSQIEQGDTSSAILSLKNAVRIEPKNAQSRYELGSLYLQVGDLFSAEKEIEKAIELGSSEPMLLPYLAKIKMLLGKYDETYDIADNSGAYNNEQYVIILTYAGLAAIAENKKGVAGDYINQALMLSEDSLYSQVGSAWLKFSDENYNEVSSILDNILAESNDFSDALLLSGHLYQAKNDYKKATEMYSSYLDKHPRQFQVKLYLINSLLSEQNYEEAEKHLGLLNKIYKNHPVVSLYNAQVEYHKENFTDAKLFAEQAINTNGTMYMGQLIAGMSAFRLGELELSYSYLNKVGPLLPANHEVKKVLAMLQFQLGFVSDAQLTFESMNADSVNDMNLLNAASRAFAQKGQYQAAENLLEKVVKKNPDNTELAVQYSALKLASGDDKQLGLLEQLAKSSEKAADAPIILATYYINEKDFDNAFRIAREWQATEAGKIKGQLLEGFVFVNKNEIDSAKKVFNRVLEQDKNNIPANYYLGEFAFNKKDWQEAKTYFKDILSFEPTHKASVARLSYINAQLGQQEETIDYLNELLIKYPDNQDIIIDLSINLSLVGKTKEAINLIEQSNIEVKTTRFNRNLAQLYVKDLKYIQAKELYKSLVTTEPASSDIWLEYASVDEKMGNIESALTTINNALNNVTVKEKLLILKANLLLILDRYDTAASIINELYSQSPKNKSVIYLKAQLNLSQDKANEASEQFSELYSVNPSNQIVLSWAQSYLKQGNQSKAIEVLEKHEQVHSLNSPNKALLAELLLKVNPLKSKELYLDLNNQHPNNVAVLNNLAWAYYNLGEYSKGLTYAEQVYNLSKSSITLDTYAMLLIANKQEAMSIDLITRDENESLMNDSLKLTLIESYISLNQKDKAEAVFNQFTQISDDLKPRYNQLSGQLN